MEFTIQNLVFPTDAKHKGCRKLFYRGDHGIIDEEKHTLTLGYAQFCDFVTYLNACSWQKWQRYTKAKRLSLKLTLAGKAKITLLGYHKDAFSVVRKHFETRIVNCKKSKTITLEYPENNEQMVGFEIVALSGQVVVYDGRYVTEINEEELNPVTLCVATTTCKKEDYIRKNLRLIDRGLFQAEDEVAQNCYIHIVDNGNTLTMEDLPENEHFLLHTNLNTGGSGGYARGMLEALQQPAKATHVLLMDDDVLVLPESLRRTYCLLRLMKSEYSKHFISGAMLYYENPECQLEDIGLLKRDDTFGPLKGEFNHASLRDNLQNEQDFPAQSGTYGAWWYCCIPVQVIEEFGLPLPMFIRGDDIEYSMRCKAQFITMNGICIWHLGFASKHSNFLRYQEQRNHLIMQTLDDCIDEQAILRKNYTIFRQEMLRFNYEGAYASVRALEDFCRGPEYLQGLVGTELLEEFKDYEHTLQPLAEMENGSGFRVEELWNGMPMRLQTRLFMKLTWNGQKCWPKGYKARGTGQAIYDGDFQPERVVHCTRILAVEPFYMQGVYHALDRTKFNDLMKRYKQVRKYYRKHRDELRATWRNAQASLVSKEYWKQHLGLD